MTALPGILNDVASITGVDKALRLGRHFAGLRVCWPALAAIERLERDQAILREFDGANISELARKYSLSRTHLYRIIKKRRSRKG